MASADAYSSDEEDSAFPRSSRVSLGFVDVEIERSDDEPTVEDSFIGGQPVWFDGSRPDDSLLKCKNCISPMALILQAYAPLEGSYYDRIIYVFGCKKSECNRKPGSIRALRALSKDPKRMEELKQEDLNQQLDSKLKVDEGKNFLLKPICKEGRGCQGLCLCCNKAAPAKPLKKQEATDGANKVKELPEYPGYFLYVDEEKFQKKQHSKKLPDNVHINDSALDFENEVGGSSRELSNEQQAIAAGLQDKSFQHFSEVVEYNPLQVLRYDIGGSPLLFSSKDETSVKITKNLVPKPGYNPSSSRQFELQVMPKAIIDFERDQVEITGGIEWGTIIVYTDKEDYMPGLNDGDNSSHVGYVEEWVGVQWEEPITKK
ncbi:hypothetical protein BN1211_1354 [Cyberlindnera jadinii]|uniref:Programmed cell death protein 2 C-terminal domain-containing protein n=1 Tax=Cyberlindnera jadinii (strain ATCC 18201 / CBS 1600 / BCRC 20928 / JCM 3617 / NBRC 0987 / NRRL Y-1542) TaxID=983966 RepID=A0A0H5C105_CYBJN|nr:hypothetical protein BN1211_1354 [Cyberlindnera jadinii]